MNPTIAWLALGALVLVAALILIEFAVAGLRENLGTNRAAWWTRRRT